MTREEEIRQASIEYTINNAPKCIGGDAFSEIDMDAKKYKLTDETIIVDGRTLYRIKALKGFANVRKGEVGGFVESEGNLSQENNCWIYNNAKAYGNAKVYDGARIYGNAKIFGNSWVCDNVCIYGNAQIYDNAQINDNAMIHYNAKIYENAVIRGNAEIGGNAIVYGNAVIFNRALITNNAEVFGNAKIWGNVTIYGNAKVSRDSDYIVFKNWWSSGRYFTWTRSNNMWNVGCFYGTGEELIAKAYKDSELSGREYERVVKYVESILKEQ